MEHIEQAHLIGERALYAVRDAQVVNTVFSDGESPVKECANVELQRCLFHWYYPVWYSKHIRMTDCTLFSDARAGIWYCEDVSVQGGIIEAPKCFRRCRGLKLRDLSMTGAAETLWHCREVELSRVTVKGDYFAMNSEDLTADGLSLVGKYSFDGVKNVTLRNSHLLTKDAFWNSENVTVYDSTVIGEYVGWNAKNLTFVNCTVESLQGLCYVYHLTLRNCRLLNTALAFEYSKVDAEITGRVDSVFNPSEGRIVADAIAELTVDRDRVDPSKTVIVCRGAE